MTTLTRTPATGDRRGPRRHETPKITLEWVAVHIWRSPPRWSSSCRSSSSASTALMSDQQSLTRQLWPDPFEWHNCVDVWQHAGLLDLVAQHPHVRRAGHVLTLLSSIPVAYALACFRFRGRNLAMMVVIATMMLPPQVVIIPLYLVWAKRLPPDRHAVAADHPDGVRRRVLDLPAAAVPADRSRGSTSTRRKVDGCGEFRALIRVMLPMARPAIAAVGAVPVLLLLERLLRPADLRQREPGGLDAQLRARSRSRAPTTPTGTSPWPPPCW